eukprot:m51a1_g5330 putative aaa family (228) ;mRNA; r:388627-389442
MEYDTVSADATARAIAALRQASDAVVGPESPRRGTAVYYFARPLATRGCESGERLHFTEVFADSAACFAELGKSVAELEERLTDVLSLASHWGALVLLDEGDALIEHRKPGELQINSMTGVLLRLLESFEGALFITSNRAHNIDPAAISRVTLAIRYERLTSTSVRSVWRSTLVRVLGDEVVGTQQQRRGLRRPRLLWTPSAVTRIAPSRFRGSVVLSSRSRSRRTR